MFSVHQTHGAIVKPIDGKASFRGRPETRSDIAAGPSSIAPIRDSDRRFMLFSLLALAVVFTGLTTAFNSFHAFWSPDSGARFVMIRHWIENGSLLTFHNPRPSLDPQGRLFPFRFYRADLPGGFGINFPPLFPFLSALLYRPFGFAGLTILPVLGGMGTVAATSILARQSGFRIWRWTFPALGLATPVLLYSSVFWDHSIHMGLSAFAALLLFHYLRTRRNQYAVGAGAILGIGVAFHELFLLLTAGYLLFGLLNTRLRRGSLLLLAGFLPPFLLWMAVNQLLYGHLFGSHFLGNFNPQREHLAAHVFDPSPLTDRALLELFGADPTGTLAEKLALLVGAVTICSRMSLAVRRAIPLLYFGGATLSAALVFRCDWAWGLFEATPLLIPAVAVCRLPEIRGENEVAPALPEKVPRDIYSDDFYRWIGFTSFFFIAASLFNPIMPGMNWGSRYLLFALPLLVLLALRTIESEIGASDRLRRAGGIVSAIFLLLASGYSQFRGALAIRGDLVFSRYLCRSVEAEHPALLATDLWWAPEELAGVETPGKEMMVRPEDRKLYFRTLVKLGFRNFTLLSTPDGVGTFVKGTAWRRVRIQRITGFGPDGVELAVFDRSVPRVVSPIRR